MPDVVPAFFIFSNVSNDEKYTGNRNRWKKVFHYRNYKPKLRTFNEGTETEYTVDLNKLAKVYDMYEFPGENKGFFQNIPEAEYFERELAFNNDDETTLGFPSTRFSSIPIVTLELISSDVSVALMLTNVTTTSVTIKASAAFTGTVVVRAIYSDSYPARSGWDLISAVQEDASYLESIGVLFDAEYEEYPSINITGINEYYATALNPTEDAIIQHDILEAPTIASPYSGSAYIDFYATAAGTYYSNSMYYLHWSPTDPAIEYMEANPPIVANLELFLDPASSDTIITSGTIEQLGDRSSYGRHFDQSTIARRPVVIKRKEYGNKQIISFNRHEDFLTTVTDFSPGGEKGVFTLYVYHRSPGPTGTAGVIFGETSTASDSAYALFRTDTSIFSRFNSNPTNQEDARDLLDTTGINTLVTRLNSISTGSRYGLPVYEDGVSLGPSYQTVGTPFAKKLTPLPYKIGSRNTVASEPLEGEIACMLIYSELHNDEQIKTVTDWLEWKYAPASEPEFELDTPAISGHLQIMLDPSGSNTTVVDGTISQLGDESGSGLHATQGTDFRRPVYLEFDPDFGGHPSFIGDGYETGMQTPAFQPGLQADGDDTFWTVYGVIKTGTSLDESFIFGQLVGGGTGRFSIRQRISDSILRFYFSNPGGSYTFKDVGVSPDTVYRFAASWDISDGPDAIPEIYLDGVLTGSYSGTAASSDTEFENISQGVGYQSTSNFNFDGKIGLLAGYNSRHSAEMIRAMDEWLVWKYAPISASISASLEEARYDEIVPPITANIALNLNPNGDSTVTAVSGAFTICSQLGDESGNARHAVQAVTSQQPIVNLADSEFNGKDSLSFDGLDDGFATPSFQPGDGRTHWTVYGVIRTGTSASDVRVFGQQTGTGTFGILQRGSGTQLRFYYYNPGSSRTSKLITVTAESVVRFAVVFDSSNGADAVPVIYIDGAADATAYSDTTAATAAAFDTGASGVGSNISSTSSFFDGKIATIIAYDQRHSVEMIRTMDKWLKWNFIP